MLAGTHARTQGLVKGKLIVLDDLPQHLKQSMFEKGGEYPVVCRYSSEPGDPGLDVRSIILGSMSRKLKACLGPYSPAAWLRDEGLQCSRRHV